jgi:hypothetical protein
MNELEELYKRNCSTPSDINEHLPTLKKYGEDCESITEMGVRSGVSTTAFIMSIPNKLLSIDIETMEKYGSDTNKFINFAKEKNVDYQFILGDTTKIEIDETDLLFIDTEHNYLQLKTELLLHGNKAKKYLIFHDTVTFGESDSNAYNNYQNLIEIDKGDKLKKGLNIAIEEFINNNPQWNIHEIFKNCCGLTILKRNDEIIK